MALCLHPVTVEPPDMLRMRAGHRSTSLIPQEPESAPLA